MDEIISYKMCAVKVRNAKLRNYSTVNVGRICDVENDRPLHFNTLVPTVAGVIT
jgi:hypothetical protein